MTRSTAACSTRRRTACSTATRAGCARRHHSRGCVPRRTATRWARVRLLRISRPTHLVPRAGVEGARPHAHVTHPQGGSFFFAFSTCSRPQEQQHTREQGTPIPRRSRLARRGSRLARRGSRRARRTTSGHHTRAQNQNARGGVQAACGEPGHPLAPLRARPRSTRGFGTTRPR